MNICSGVVAPVRAALTVALLVVLAGCAALGPRDPESRAEWLATNDPLEPMNRYFFEVNRGLDQLILFPVADTYRGAVPSGARQMANNFLHNLRSPVIFANDLMQGDVERAGQTFGRFLANTLIGVGGLFEVTDIERHDEDFGQTLAVWGVGDGFYLVLPGLGPQSPRSLLGLGVDSLALDPIGWWARADSDRFWVQPARFAGSAVDSRSRNIETLDEIERTSIDFYATIRSLYRQRRQDAINNGVLQEADGGGLLELEFDDDEATTE